MQHQGRTGTLVKDRMEFSSGWIYERKMFAELVARDRIHVTADDMPMGADILLHDRGFRFTPYRAWGSFHGRLYRMRFHDECVLDEQGRIHDTIRMFFFGLPVGTMFLGPLGRYTDGDTLPPNQPAAPNAGIASRLTVGHHCPRVGEPDR